VTRRSQTLLLRADGGTDIGIGHLMRCIALAQAWQDEDGKATIASARIPEIALHRAELERVELVEVPHRAGSALDASLLCELAAERDAAVVIDGYVFGTRFQETVCGAVRQLLVIDDHGRAGEYHAHFILDQNLGASEEAYRRRPPDSRLLLGPRFALLRREFRKYDQRATVTPRYARRILISLGGSEQDLVMRRIIGALQRIEAPSLDIRVVVGGCESLQDDWNDSLHGSSRLTLERDVEDMCSMMAWADLVVTAAGSTCWELARLGVPALLIAVADNQESIGHQLADFGAARFMGRASNVTIDGLAAELDHLIADQEQRQLMSRRAVRLVDGQGALRVAATLMGGDP
jgi:UDP-2,4-diacetamido-2,4,6-trideoxy-beta-L-altropyranose hydrolase